VVSGFVREEGREDGKREGWKQGRMERGKEGKGTAERYESP